MRLAGQHALITGGGSGIGAAIACVLAAEGATLSLVGRRAEPLAAIARATGGTPIRADVRDADAVAAAFAAARAAGGAISILVANAGAAATSRFAATSDADWHAMIAANLTSAFYCTRAALPDLLAAPAGRIVAVASTAALKGYAGCAAYAAAKHGLLGMIRSLAVELAATNVTANALCPGFTDTAIVADAVAGITRATGRDAAAARAALVRFNPQGRLIDPAEVAAAALWLCLPEARGITGQAIAISGGETM
jgi:NAD(P)-dependent dehydrogenase (short-subunit alcohol dehydrogenase family)